MFNLKRLLQLLVVAFIIYAIFTSPDRAGDILHSAWDVIAQGFKSLGSFFDSLLGRG
ncbi:hypothetical protein [Segeticoccus rhizosphaerae]|jgi:hypothetical protein|uniref:hypothetical protein n=1 Tax=Segeticoccus rhizosphaerae TaxID=1104777 RepID=UPI00192E30E7|nr:MULTISPECIES: hypothetical protein [Intrasporangiaceae]